MRFKSLCLRVADYRKSVRVWRKWFAWYPVMIDSYYYWLVRLERRAVSFSWDDRSKYTKWEYRLIDK